MKPTQVFLPGNPMDRGAWWATVHGGHRRVGNNLATKQQQMRGSEDVEPSGGCAE